VVTLVVSGLPHGGDIGVESAGFVPLGFSAGDAAYLADRFSRAAGLYRPGNRALRDSMAWVRNAAPKLMTEAK
jgi:hypothetical protein